MSYRFEKTAAGVDIVIDGFEDGIADSPYEGIADMRNMNIISSPKQASVAFATTAITLPPAGYISIAFSSDSTTDIFTTASTAGFYTGMAVTIVTVSGAGSGIAGTTYYVSNITATTFKLYSDLSVALVLDVTTSRTGTFTVQTFGSPIDSVSSPSTTFDSTGRNQKNTFVMTTDGLAWYIRPSGAQINTVQFLGNLLHSTAGTPNYGIAVFKNYLFIFQQQVIDYMPLTALGAVNPSGAWIYAWQATSPSPTGHRAISATDDALYFCNAKNVGSVLEIAGATFNPATPATYTYNATALALPSFDKSTCLSQLGTTLLIGGVQNFIYPWDRISTSFTYPLICAENFIACIVSTNSSAYIFAGNRGRIYITNGANVEEYKKIPDYLSGTVDPYYTWGWGIYWKDQLYFTFSATDNAGVAISNFAGLWAIDIESEKKPLRLTNSLSYGTYAGTVPTIVNMGGISPTGDGIYACWVNSTGGIDYTSNTPYTSLQPYIDTELIPVGTFLTKKTFQNVEWKVAKPLVTGESISIYYRVNLTDSFTLLGTTTTAGLLSDQPYPVTFETSQWLQFRVVTSSTATNPSYVPLTELRLR